MQCPIGGAGRFRTMAIDRSRVALILQILVRQTVFVHVSTALAPLRSVITDMLGALHACCPMICFVACLSPCDWHHGTCKRSFSTRFAHKNSSRPHCETTPVSVSHTDSTKNRPILLQLCKCHIAATIIVGSTAGSSPSIQLVLPQNNVLARHRHFCTRCVMFPKTDVTMRPSPGKISIFKLN